MNISDEGRDLLLKLMAFKPEDRITAAEALKHAWFKKAAKGEYNKKELGEALQAMKKF
jgi:serine/threonine protein kinase